jgi:hypothetical protein
MVIGHLANGGLAPGRALLADFFGQKYSLVENAKPFYCMMFYFVTE